MVRLRLLLSDISGLTVIQVATWASIFTILGFLVVAYDGNATDKEVKTAIDQLKLESQKDLAKFMAHVLNSLKALEIRVVNGDNSILIEMITSEIRRLNQQKFTGSEMERADAIKELTLRREQLDRLMDNMRIMPTPKPPLEVR